MKESAEKVTVTVQIVKWKDLSPEVEVEGGWDLPRGFDQEEEAFNFLKRECSNNPAAGWQIYDELI